MASPSKDKWLKYRYLKEYEPLSPHIPETRLISAHAIWSMLEKYKSVIVKPVWGSRGRGVIQITALGKQRYRLHLENRKTILTGKQNVIRYLRGKIGETTYMVQQTVDRPTINGRPFDMRVIVQRKKGSPDWIVTAKIIKVAGKGYIVSNNSRSKGSLQKYETGMRKSSIRYLPADPLKTEIYRVALVSTKRLSMFFNGHRIYGFDMGPDQTGRVWVIEANLFPSKSHFRKLKDKTMLRRIEKYER